jgi:hypothetical protein
LPCVQSESKRKSEHSSTEKEEKKKKKKRKVDEEQQQHSRKDKQPARRSFEGLRAEEGQVPNITRIKQKKKILDKKMGREKK